MNCADLEYSLESNKEADGNQLVDTLLDLCAAALKAGSTIHFTDPAMSLMGTGRAWVVEGPESASHSSGIMRTFK